MILQTVEPDNLTLRLFASITPKDESYTGPVLEKVEILEIRYEQQCERCDFYGLNFADHCPALKSAYHYIERRQRFFDKNDIKNHFLEDLVIEFGRISAKFK
uniref:Uncharacterized protein n=1 Tax=Tetranychus urticae TaxID=32264 RepID=T1KJ40_TETUR